MPYSNAPAIIHYKSKLRTYSTFIIYYPAFKLVLPGVEIHANMMSSALIDTLKTVVQLSCTAGGVVKPSPFFTRNKQQVSCVSFPQDRAIAVVSGGLRALASCTHLLPSKSLTPCILILPSPSTLLHTGCPRGSTTHRPVVKLITVSA